MKHEYKVGQEVWYKGEQVRITDIDSSFGGAAKFHDGNREDVCDLSDLSPYPPVKAVDGWAVVKGGAILMAGISEIAMGCNAKALNDVNGCDTYRCIPVTITAKKD